MPEITLTMFAMLLARAAGETIIALLLAAFYRVSRKRYIFNWSLAWAALVVEHVCAAASVHPTVHSIPILVGILAIAGKIAAFLQITWFSFGAYELARQRPIKFRLMRLATISTAAAGGLVAIAHAQGWFSKPAAELDVAALSLAGGIVALWCSGMIWRARARDRGLGFTIAATSFGLLGAHQIGLGILTVLPAQGSSPIAGYMDFVAVALEALVGLSMIICLLEDEREAAAMAAFEIETLAYHDPLTGLPNRSLFFDRLILALAQAHRYNHRAAILFLDLDRFKNINDSLGHSMGDALLRMAAERIRLCLTDGDTVARFGGDEFTVLIPQLDHIEEAAKIAERILEVIRLPFIVGTRELFATASIGVSVYPSDGQAAETLVKNADTAMYRAKEQGRDTFQLYAPAMNAKAAEKLALENLLRKAISQNELVLYYQPQIDVRTGALHSAEALLRWKHPEFGILSPSHFIHVAEISGLIVPIGEWVLRTATAHAVAWEKTIGSRIGVSVNLSPRQFMQADLLQQVEAALHESGLDPSLLDLEITESGAMHSPENNIRTMRELRALGVRISMDDFGTGYSSLSALKRFPIDTLKLDQSFVRDLHHVSDAAIATAVITMAHSLQLSVVAEGVEREDQFEFLSRNGCDRIQGYLVSAALPETEFEDFVRRSQQENESLRSGDLRPAYAR